MKIIKFRVTNYKSILYSGDCYLENGVTILAGKNESGKSSLLQALADFNIGVSIDEKVCPIHDEKLIPTIEIDFALSNEDIDTILTQADIPGLQAKSIPKTVFIEKNYTDQYIIDDSFFETAKVPQDKNYRNEFNKLYNTVFTKSLISSSQNNGLPIPDISKLNYSTIVSALSTYQTAATSIIPHFSVTEQAIVQNNLPELIAIANEAAQAGTQPRARLTSAILKNIPNFILFSSFDDIFPNQIPLAELKSNKWINDLAEITDLDIEIITGENSRAKKTHNNKLNINLNKDFSQFWSQDLSILEIEWDNVNLRFWIKEDGEYYEPEIRSQGRRWHLAFYIRISARSRENISNVILIDEPGLYLHAAAQKDILNKLEDAATTSQIIFSTHSPYLIEPEKLGRIRLVIKEEGNGTIVENKIHKVSDKETLTPILSAIGLGLNCGISNVDKRNNVIVEGMSDYYYLSGFKNIFKKNTFNVIFGGGAGNMPNIGMIIHGWGGNVIYLYDNDQAYTDALKNTKKEWAIITREQLLALQVDGSIEDIFTPVDFAKHILNIDPETLSKKNSEFMKGKDKVLKAKFFYNMTEHEPTISLEKKTLINIDSLVTNIEKLFE